MPNLDVQLVFLSIELCAICAGILWLEIFHYKSGLYITSLWSYHFTGLRESDGVVAGFLQASHRGWMAWEKDGAVWEEDGVCVVRSGRYGGAHVGGEEAQGCSPLSGWAIGLGEEESHTEACGQEDD